MKVARLRTERGKWNGVGKLEEANGELEERIRSLFLKEKEKEEGPENFEGGSHRQ
jgi:hypothetical protein